MTRRLRRIRDYLITSRMLVRAGATYSSIVLFPVRRRLRQPRNHVALRDGVSLVSPVDEPLLGLIEEIWADRCYLDDEPGATTGGDIVDIGAHVGVFSAWAAQRYPGSRIIAVEPSSRMCAALRRNVAANGFDAVTVMHAACGAAPGDVPLYSRGPEAMNSLYDKDNYGSAFRVLETVKVVTIDHIFHRFAIERCDLLKLDCEGAEYDILFNASISTLARVRRIAMEYHVGLSPGSADTLGEFLAGRGFTARWSPLLDEEGGYLHAVRCT